MEDRIETIQDLEAEVHLLITKNDLFSKAFHQTGMPGLRLRKDGFESLLSAIVSQQVSVAAARSIWTKLKHAKLTGPRKISWASEEELRQAGLSRQKIRYAKALAEAKIDFKGLRNLPSEDVVKILTEVPGIGVWTAEIYAMFSLGHKDVFAPGDLALQESARILFELEERPKERELREMAKDWSPHRAVAARLLWAYYHVIKKREGIS